MDKEFLDNKMLEEIVALRSRMAKVETHSTGEMAVLWQCLSYVDDFIDSYDIGKTPDCLRCKHLVSEDIHGQHCYECTRGVNHFEPDELSIYEKLLAWMGPIVILFLLAALALVRTTMR